jgi:uncharacterized protein (TIGR00730 family)
MKKGAYFRVAIFGSARIKKHDSRYALVFDLAKEIATEGIDIVTGGGPGLMDAANRGHHAGRRHNRQNKPYSIGLTINLPKEQKTSPHLDLRENFSEFSKRLDKFTLLSNAVVVTPGGVGTTLEFLYVWQLVQVKKINNIPIILLGKEWADFYTWIKKWPLHQHFLEKEETASLHLAKNSSEAIALIKEAHKTWLASQQESFAKSSRKGVVSKRIAKYPLPTGSEF